MNYIAISSRGVYVSPAPSSSEYAAYIVSAGLLSSLPTGLIFNASPLVIEVTPGSSTVNLLLEVLASPSTIEITPQSATIISDCTYSAGTSNVTMTILSSGSGTSTIVGIIELSIVSDDAITIGMTHSDAFTVTFEYGDI